MWAPCTSAQVREWLEQLCSGFAYVHSLHILHRDIAPKNVLITADLRCKITDFGLSFRQELTSKSYALASTLVGTPYYMAPEVFKSEPYGPAADVWSLGVVGLRADARTRTRSPAPTLTSTRSFPLAFTLTLT